MRGPLNVKLECQKILRIPPVEAFNNTVAKIGIQ